jgi:hypothetical protein
LATCPHISHNAPKDVTWEQSSVSFCRDGCQRTFFFCANCGQANRPLARYCRSCAKDLSFIAGELECEKRYSFDVGGEQYSYDLSRYGIGAILFLESYKGLLFVAADNGLLTFDVRSLSKPVTPIFRPPDGSTLRGVNFFSGPDDDSILITTFKSIYQVSLLDLELPDRRPQYKKLYEATQPRSISHPVTPINGSTYLLEYDEGSNRSWLTSIGSQDGISFEGISRPPVALSRDRLFIFTDRQALLFDRKNGRLVEIPSNDLLRNAPAAYDAGQQIVYLAGQAGIWRVDLASDQPSLAPLTTKKPLRDAAVAARDDKLYVAHLGGISILDRFGTKKWDSSEDAFIQVQPDGFPPQLYGSTFTFTILGRMGGRIVRTHRTDNPGDYKDRVIASGSLSCPPLLTIGRVFAAVEGAAGAQLNVYDSGSP